ncbi:MAG: hypothetical protein CK425_01345 [Parachlamydia sp.]|nr:MAG: hypothetical protein CK425_01345 [Parachlamydia sp.]
MGIINTIRQYFHTTHALNQERTILTDYVRNPTNQKIEILRAPALVEIVKAKSITDKMTGFKLQHRCLVKILGLFTFKWKVSAYQDNIRLIKKLEDLLNSYPGDKSFEQVNVSETSTAHPHRLNPSHRDPIQNISEKPLKPNRAHSTDPQLQVPTESVSPDPLDPLSLPKKTAKQEILSYMHIYNDEKLGKLKFRGKGEFIIRKSSMDKHNYPENAKQAFSLDINDGIFITPNRFFLMDDGQIQYGYANFKTLKELLEKHAKFEKNDLRWISLDKPKTASELIESALEAEASQTVNTAQDPVFYNNLKNYPFVPFNPLYILDGPGFDFLAKEMESNPAPAGLKLYMDHTRKLAFLGHGVAEIKAIAPHYPPLLKIIGSVERSIFDGYGPRYVFMKNLEETRVPILAPINPNYVNLLITKARMKLAFSHSADPQLNLPAIHSHSQLAKEILEKHEGLVIGEIHSHITPKKFIIDQMQTFKECGVTTLFLEHLFYETLQEDLDAFFKSSSDEFPLILNKILERPEIHPDKILNYKAMILAAKKAGIRVVAIDTNLSYQAGFDRDYGSQGPHRCEGMNYTAAEIIKKERGKGKFVLLVGSAHSSQCEGVKGMREILDCPSLIISDAVKDDMEKNVENFVGKLKKVDVLLSVATPQLAVTQADSFYRNAKLLKLFFVHEKSNLADGTYSITPRQKYSFFGLYRKFVLITQIAGVPHEYKFSINSKNEIVLEGAEPKTFTFFDASAGSPSFIGFLKEQQLIKNPLDLEKISKFSKSNKTFKST